MGNAEQEGIQFIFTEKDAFEKYDIFAIGLQESTYVMETSGLLITFHVDGTKFAFISCHLAAHEGIKHCEDRNASIVEILGGVRAGDKTYDIAEQFHHVWWMGDMNYRLTYDKAVPKSVRKNTPGYSSETTSASTDDVSISLTEGEEEDEDDSEDEAEERAAAELLAAENAKNNTSPAGMKKKALALKNRNRTMRLIIDKDYKEMLDHDELNREIAS
eukprot:gene38277-47260_t